MINSSGCIKIGCLVIIILCVLFVVYSISVVSDDSSSYNAQPFEVVTKTGKVSLHLGMPKDSVILLLGDPDESSAHSFGNTIIDEIGYKVKGKSYTDLNFRFENGKLESFRQE